MFTQPRRISKRTTRASQRRQSKNVRQLSRHLRAEHLEGRTLLATLATGTPEFVAGEILVGFHDETAAEIDHFGLGNAFRFTTDKVQSMGIDLGEFLSKDQMDKRRGGLLTKFTLEAGKDVLETARELSQLPGVAFAEPNYIWSDNAVPDDSSFDELWGLNNTGQTGGTPDADIDAPEAWEYGTGSHSVIVGVIDSGVDYNHPDLAANIWNNPGECLGPGGSCQPDGIDNDQNGYVDDFHGINAITGSGDPMDDRYHGTHVAGTIGAVGDNGIGVVGVNHDVTIVACKFLDETGNGSTSDAVECFEYFNDLKQAGHNIVITNNSWGGGGYSQSLINAMTGPTGMDPILHVASAGNGNNNNDAAPYYPASYDHPNLVSVASTDDDDDYASSSSYGATKVDLAAPGVGILSTMPNNEYGTLNGTSMAAPHVAGAAALVQSLHPSLTALQLKQALMQGSEIVSHATKSTVSNGRLNVRQTLENLTETDNVAPDPVTDLAVVEMGMISTTLTWTATGDDGSLGPARMYDVRYSTSPINAANWSSAIPAIGEPRPGAPGTVETFHFHGLEQDTDYHFALKVVDNLGNESPLSNLGAGKTVLGEELFDDGFETGLDKWTADAPWGLTTSQSYAGNYSVTDSPSGNYSNNANTSLTSVKIDLEGIREAELKFWHRYNLEQDVDYGRLEVSTNGGTSWTELASYTGTSSSFQQASIDLSAYAGRPSLLMRFRLEADSSISRDGWYIDDVQLSGVRTPGVQVSNATVVEGDAGTKQLQFNVTRYGDSSQPFTVDYATIGDTAWAEATSGTPVFNRQVIDSSADFAYSLAAADLDGDHDLDIVSAAANDDTIVWYENDGNGNFTTHVISDTVDGVRAVVTADLDHDGDIDVLSASSSDDTIAWYENDGGGNFVTHIISNTADGARSVFVADVDGDGDLDVQSASGTDDTVAWYENDGNENFTIHVLSDSLEYATSVYAADADGDGDVDVLAAGATADRIEWYENDGNENFSVNVISLAVDNPRSLFLADLNGDNNVDILSASSSDDTIQWFEMIGEQFVSHTITTAADSAWSVSAADLDNDGDVDVLSASVADDTVAWYENDGSGNFIAHKVSVTSDGARSVIAADLDSDGDLDIVAAAGTDDTVAWFSNTLIDPVPADFRSASGTLSFASGEMEKLVAITVLGDAEVEEDEQFFLQLANTTEGVAISDRVGTGTIVDNDQPIVLFADSFESGQWNGLWVEDSQNDWFTSTQRATSGNYSAEVDGRATNATLTVANAFDLTPFADVELTFSWYIESGFDSGETLSLDMYADGVWHEDVAILRGNIDQENTWHEEEITLDPSYLTDDFRIRFSALVSRSNEDANVDDVRLIANSYAIPPNQSPTAINDAYQVDEDASLSVTAILGVLSNDSDPDSDPLTAALISGPSNGDLSLSADGAFEYTPNANYHGTDSFSYLADDGTNGSNVASATITVNAVADAPSAGDITVGTSEDSAYVFSVADFGFQDVDAGDSLQSVAIKSLPAAGSLQHDGALVAIDQVVFAADIAAGSLQFVPVANESGSAYASIDFTVSDGVLSSAPANTITIDVAAVNDVPVATDHSYTIDEDTLLAIGSIGVLTGDTDADGDPLTALLASGPTHGELTLNADGSFEYLPDLNFFGTDSFSYQANDGLADSHPATVTITVESVNDAPFVTGDDYTIDQDTVLNVAAPGVLTNDSDVDGDDVTVAVVDGPSHGALSLNSDGSLVYTPTPGYFGFDSFTYHANDGQLNSEDVATVSITINRINVAPVAFGDSYSVDEDSVLTVSASGLLANDTDAEEDPLNAVLVDPPVHGHLALNTDGSFSYTPNVDFNGSDSFTYRANDGIDDSNIATASITVNAVNDIPVVENDAYEVLEDQTLEVLFPGVLSNDTDVDGDELELSLVSNAAHGIVSLSEDGSFSYTPASNYFGGDTFVYEVTDGQSSPVQATVSISVTSVNDVPLADPQSVSTDEDQPLAITLDGFDLETDAASLSYTVVSLPSGGTLSGTGAYRVYTPAEDFNGVDSFRYVVNDGTTDSNEATISILVNPVNDAPQATDDVYSVDQDSVLTISAPGILANDTDVELDALTTAVVSGPDDGQLSLNENGSFSYTPNAGFFGIDSFTYRTSDGNGGEDTATVAITVNEVADESTMYVADLDGSSQRIWFWWRASVSIRIVDESGAPVQGAAVSGQWSGSYSGSANLTTNSSGFANATSGNIWRGSNTTFTVTNVSHPDVVYDAASNTDPDGDSSGTAIVIFNNGSTAPPNGGNAAAEIGTVRENDGEALAKAEFDRWPPVEWTTAHDTKRLRRLAVDHALDLFDRQERERRQRDLLLRGEVGAVDQAFEDLVMDRI